VWVQIPPTAYIAINGISIRKCRFFLSAHILSPWGAALPLPNLCDWQILVILPHKPPYRRYPIDSATRLPFQLLHPYCNSSFYAHYSIDSATRLPSQLLHPYCNSYPLRTLSHRLSNIPLLVHTFAKLESGCVIFMSKWDSGCKEPQAATYESSGSDRVRLSKWDSGRKERRAEAL
jgi:hypothetical protein